MENRPQGPGGDADRAVSNVLGVILVVSVVLTGVIATVGFGVTGLAGTTTDLSDTTAERELVGLASTIDSTTVYSEVSPSRATFDLATAEVAGEDNRFDLDETAGTLTLTIRNESTDRTIVSTALGILEYENPRSEARMAYQSGLVFAAPTSRETPGIVRRNAFEHRVAAGVHGITMHITRLDGNETLGDDVDILATNRRSPSPEAMVDGTEDLVVRIKSAYYEGWTLALQDVFPENRTTITTNPRQDELVLVYDTPDGGAFLHAVVHEVGLDD